MPDIGELTGEDEDTMFALEELEFHNTKLKIFVPTQQTFKRGSMCATKTIDFKLFGLGLNLLFTTDTLTVPSSNYFAFLILAFCTHDIESHNYFMLTRWQLL